jgi:hypothetical protein
MPDWLVLPVFFVGYYAVMRWVLPRFGVQT